MNRNLQARVFVQLVVSPHSGYAKHHRNNVAAGAAQPSRTIRARTER